jgi:hypothetical protein
MYITKASTKLRLRHGANVVRCKKVCGATPAYIKQKT